MQEKKPVPGARQELPGEGPVTAVGEAKELFGRNNFVRAKHEGDLGRPTENKALDESTNQRDWVSNEEMQDAFDRNAQTFAAIRGANPNFTRRQIYDMLVDMGKV